MGFAVPQQEMNIQDLVEDFQLFQHVVQVRRADLSDVHLQTIAVNANMEELRVCVPMAAQLDIHAIQTLAMVTAVPLVLLGVHHLVLVSMDFAPVVILVKQEISVAKIIHNFFPSSLENHRL